MFILLEESLSTSSIVLIALAGLLYLFNTILAIVAILNNKGSFLKFVVGIIGIFIFPLGYVAYIIKNKHGK